MIFRDLREWLDAVKDIKELTTISSATLDEEIAGLTELFQEEMGRNALLFDHIDGGVDGYRILSNSCTSIARIALTLNMPVESTAMDVVQNWRALLSDYRPIKPKMVTDGPVFENKLFGDDVDLDKFPCPMWHPDDGGRYIGTGDIVVSKDFDSDWINCGCYRMMLQGKDAANLFIVKGKHGSLMQKKYWDAGKPFPVAVSLGHDPIYYLMGGMEIPFKESEYDFIGAIRREPVELVSTPLYGIPVPASSEIVLEGEVLPDDMLPEGPFGEWTGYYAGGRRQVPVMRIKGIYHRNNPIMLAGIPCIPPGDINYYRSPLRSATVWDQLEKAGVPGVTSVWAHEVGGARLLIIVAIKQMYAGHAHQAGLIASQCHAAAYANKAVVVVDNDIDVTNLTQVTWAILTRTSFTQDMDILKNCWTSKVDPTSYPEGENCFNDRVVIDACRPWERRDSFPPVIRIKPETKAHIMGKWPELFSK